MKIIFLGTNGWYDTKTGNTLCVLIETRTEYIILDAGGGFYKIGRYVTGQKPVYLFLSHFHLDHVIGLHTLAKFSFPQGIDVYGPPGLKRFFRQIINKPYTMPFAKLKMDLRLHELNKKNSSPLDVKFKKLRHPVTCYGYRFSLENKIISFCTDTGVCKNLYHLAKGADLLISECAYKSNKEDNNWPHLNPRSASQMAKAAGIKRLALVHFDSNLYLTLKDRKKAEMEARSIFRNTFAAIDDTKIEF
ncbi:MAG: ribonuclease Z [Candidatus Omnitrophica bacterium]|nr:ribonuclease Z [Candidatus Omnitrophota bacterium]